MQVGDLVEFNGYVALVVEIDAYTGDIFIRWCDDGEFSNADNYPELKVINASR